MPCPYVDKKANMDRILIIRIGNIGDVLMTTPLVRKLKGMFPSSEIDFVVSPHAEFAVRANPYIDNVYVYRKYRKAVRIIRRFLFKRLVRKNKYNMCFILESNREYMRFGDDVTDKDTLKIGYDGYACSDLLDKKNEYSYENHVIENQLFLLKDFLGADVSESDLKMDFRFPEDVLRKFGSGIDKEIDRAGKYIVIHPGCTEYLPLRAWEAEKFAEIINFVTNKGTRVFITGSKNDRGVIENIMKNCKDTGKVIPFAGRDIWYAARVISRARGVLSLDTGILHLTRALNIPVIALMGPSSPAHTGPTGVGKYKAIRKEFKCGPCHFYPGYRMEDKKKCLDGNVTPCMKAITVSEVISLVNLWV
ncbi:MAG: glycosyltransferase family 9 protein [Candidatus Omnitrophica bacterium]|nr:glycosyltransferase family 9 protein [Candidatus Omnitrophota bacterium]